VDRLLDTVAVIRREADTVGSLLLLRDPDARAVGVVCNLRFERIHCGICTICPSAALISTVSNVPSVHCTSRIQYKFNEYAGLVYVYNKLVGHPISETAQSLFSKHSVRLLQVHVNTLFSTYEPIGICSISGTS
jgi:hypothetical protein